MRHHLRTGRNPEAERKWKGTREETAVQTMASTATVNGADMIRIAVMINGVTPGVPGVERNAIPNPSQRPAKRSIPMSSSWMSREIL
jgi:hypothetical protein